MSLALGSSAGASALRLLPRPGAGIVDVVVVDVVVVSGVIGGAVALDVPIRLSASALNRSTSWLR